MEKYITLAVCTINADKIQLSDDQYKTRRHLLQKTDESGVYVPLGTLNFVAGEIIGIDDSSKTNLQFLKPYKSQAEIEAEAKDKEEAEAKDKEETKPKTKTEVKSKTKTGSGKKKE